METVVKGKERWKRESKNKIRVELEAEETVNCKRVSEDN